jgi:hypothetical protein
MKKFTTTQLINISLILFAMTLPLFLGGCLGAGTPTALVNISGSWNLSTLTGTWTFNQIGTTISGQTPSGTEQITGTIVGLNINFSFTDTNGNTDSYTGTVSSDGTTMSGTYTVGTTSAPWDGTLSGSTGASISTGNWSVTDIPTGGTAGTPFTVFLSQSGSTIKGNFPTTSTGQPATEGTSVTGTVSGTSSITFSFIDTGSIISSNSISNGTYTINDAAAGTWSATLP